MEFFTKTGMAREKRPFEMESAREGMDDGKRSRPALARLDAINKANLFLWWILLKAQDYMVWKKNCLKFSCSK